MVEKEKSPSEAFVFRDHARDMSDLFLFFLFREGVSNFGFLERQEALMLSTHLITRYLLRGERAKEN